MKKFLPALIALSLLTACSQQMDSELSGETGELSLSLSANPGKTGIQVLESTTKGEGEGNDLDLNLFSIQILNQSQKVCKSWDNYSDMPSSVRLNAANYTLKSSYGSESEVGFSKPYFYGEKSFAILPQRNISVSLTCALANAKVIVEYGPNIKKDYVDFTTAVTSSMKGTSTVSFTKDETRAAYFPAGKLGVSITMKDAENVTRTFAPDSISIAAQDCMTIKVDTKEVLPGELALTITTDKSVEEVPVSVEIPAFMLPKAAPTITFDGLDDNGAVTFTEGVATSPKVEADIPGGLAKCVITPSANMQALGFPASFDLANLSDSDKKTISDLGFSWVPMKDELLTTVDISSLAGLLASGSSSAEAYSFSMKIEDQFGQSVTKNVTLNVNPPVFSLGTITAANTWATKVDNVVMNVTDGNIAKAVLQYSLDGGAWTDCTYSNRLTTATKITETVTGLASNTSAKTVKFRVKYNDHLSSEVSTTLEAATQLPNNDFETYTSYKTGSQLAAPYYWHANQSSTLYWATRNPSTAGQTSGAVKSYTSVNTTQPVEEGGSHAVKMQTAAWGAGTTTASGISVLYNVSSGVIYLGSYDFQYNIGSTFGIKWCRLASESMNQGMSFASRPATFSFDYKYAPYNGESFTAYAVVLNGSTEIARATATSNSSAQDSMKNVKFNFTYSNTTLKATSIRVFFSSSSTLGGNCDDVVCPAVAKSAAGGGPHLGSALTIDNVVLGYDF